MVSSQENKKREGILANSKRFTIFLMSGNTCSSLRPKRFRFLKRIRLFLKKVRDYVRGYGTTKEAQRF